jgi:hypothetical protein
VTPSTEDDWLPQSVRDAEAAVDEAAKRSDELLAELDKHPVPPSEGAREPRDEDVARVEREAKSPKATREMRALQEKVDDGELSWRDILAGRAFGDPEVRAALQANLTELSTVYEEFEQGYTLQDVLEARRADEGDYGDDGPETFLR